MDHAIDPPFLKEVIDLQRSFYKSFGNPFLPVCLFLIVDWSSQGLVESWATQEGTRQPWSASLSGNNY